MKRATIALSALSLLPALALAAGPTAPAARAPASAPAQPAAVEAAPKADLGLVLGEIDSESDAANTHVNVRFNGKIPWPAPEVQDHGAFLQIPLPDTVVLKSGEFIEGKGPYLAKLAVFQTSAHDGALRLFLRREGGAVKKATKVDVLNDRIVVYIDHAALEAMGITDHVPGAKPAVAAAPAAVAVKSADAGADAAPTDAAPVADGAAKATEEPSLATVLGKKAEAEAPALGFGRQTDVVQKKSVWIAGGFAAFFLLVGGLAMGRGRFFRRRSLTPAEQSVVMKTIAHHPLSPKQRLTLVQVGGEQILLGVTEGSISYLTTIGSAPAASMNRVAAAPEGMAERALGKAPTVLSPQRSFSAQGLRAPEAPRLKGEARQAKGRSFDETLNESEPAVKERAAPKAEPKGFTRTSGKINVAIDDDGVHDLAAPKAAARKAAAPAASDPKALEDVTALIRRKLRDLPSR